MVSLRSIVLGKNQGLKATKTRKTMVWLWYFKRNAVPVEAKNAVS